MSLRAWWHSLKSASDLLERMDQLEEHFREAMLDWTDKRDSLDKLLRRLTLRASRNGTDRPASQEAETEEIIVPRGSQTPKTRLRELARQKGLMP